MRGKHLSSGIVTDFGDNVTNRMVAFFAAQACGGIDAPVVWNKRSHLEQKKLSPFRTKLGLLAAGLMLSGCMQATTYQAAPEATLKPTDKVQLAKARYAKVAPAEPFRRAIVDYHRKEMPGTIVVDSDNHYLYLVQHGGKAIRYGVTVGEEALAFSGIARVGNMAEWPKWTPTADIHKRIEGLPATVPGGIDNPLGARALYLYQGNRDTLFRIHGTNQPEYIGASISSGCIRMTNEDVIDLYTRVKQGTVVVVLEPKQGDSPYNSKMALQGGGGSPMMQ
jgi:lipoprotein-anchoring transpeptidase ErfK/SrfK